MLDGLHVAKCVEHCNGEYIQAYGIKGSFLHFFFFFSVVDTALNGITYKPSFKGYLIQANAIEKLGGFFENRWHKSIW